MPKKLAEPIKSIDYTPGLWTDALQSRHWRPHPPLSLAPFPSSCSRPTSWTIPPPLLSLCHSPRNSIVLQGSASCNHCGSNLFSQGLTTISDSMRSKSLLREPSMTHLSPEEAQTSQLELKVGVTSRGKGQTRNHKPVCSFCLYTPPPSSWGQNVYTLGDP